MNTMNLNTVYCQTFIPFGTPKNSNIYIYSGPKPIQRVTIYIYIFHTKGSVSIDPKGTSTCTAVPVPYHYWNSMLMYAMIYSRSPKGFQRVYRYLYFPFPKSIIVWQYTVYTSRLSWVGHSSRLDPSQEPVRESVMICLNSIKQR